MASSSEKGHEVNLSNFNNLIQICSSFGSNFNPSKPALTLLAMSSTAITATGLQNIVSEQWALIKEPINQRQILFAPLSKMVTRIMRSLSNTDASDQFKADAKTVADDIRNMNKGNPKASAGSNTEEEFVSRSHASFVMKAANFLKLIELLKTLPSYKPNEADLMIATLEFYYQNLNKVNNGLAAQLTPYYTALRNRNKTFYTPKSGLVDTAYACKDYIISMMPEGIKSPEYKLVAKIQFTRPSK